VSRYVAFLRAINVGGHVVRMEELRRVFASIGFSDVETFIASGNVIFSTTTADTNTSASTAPRDPSTGAIERRIEAALQKAFGYAVATFVRTPGELAAVAAHVPCSTDPAAARGAVHIIFVAEALNAAERRDVAALSRPGDEFSASGREIYWCRFGKLSESPLFGKSLGKTLGAGTMRNRNTVVRLLARLQSAAPAAAPALRRTRKEKP